MKCISFVVLANAACALAAKPFFLERVFVKRQSIDTLESDIGDITSAVKTLNTDVQGFTSDNDAQKLIDASQGVVSTIGKAQSDAGAFADNSLSITVASNLIQPITTLISAIQSTVQSLSNKKPTFASLGLCGAVLSQVESQQSAASSFESVLFNKLQTSAASIAAMYTMSINAQLASASSLFTSCPSASTSSPITSSGSTAPTSSSSGSGGSTGASSPPPYANSSSAPATSLSTSTPPATILISATSTSVSVVPGPTVSVTTNTTPAAPGTAPTGVTTVAVETTTAPTAPGSPATTTTSVVPANPSSPGSTVVPNSNEAATRAVALASLLLAFAAAVAFA